MSVLAVFRGRIGKAGRRALMLGFSITFFLFGPASAAGPEGEWLVAERTARIWVADCAGLLWGVVSWEADPGVDEKNPDPAKRARPTLGMPVLLGMKPNGPNRWDGHLYNSENGRTYSGGISVLADGRLRVRGCILGFLCGGENWTRVGSANGDSVPEPDAVLCSKLDSAH